MERETVVNPNNEWLVKRVGFKPDTMVQVVGTTFLDEDGVSRQKLLRMVSAFCEPDFTPPCKLQREPGNIHDPNAVGVLAGRANIDVPGNWEYVHIGYLPKNYAIPYVDTNGSYTFDGREPERKPVWQIMDERLGTVTVGLEGIYKRSSNYGARIGLKHVLSI